ncbi:MAG: Acetolactate synthase large subunit [Rhodopila sp.]|nr:Acetolactate synthase large subunit [Rhodopila sp.]
MIDIHDGCIDNGIRIVDVRHEQTATHAADDDARRIGFSNAVTGIATAFRSVSPVLRRLDIPGYFNDAARDREHQDRSERIRAGGQGTDDVQVMTLTIVPVRTIQSMSSPGITSGGRP